MSLEKIVSFGAVVLLLLSSVAFAHDGWIQTNVPRANIDDMVYIDMQFGNHGNTHRDYKIWPSKWDPSKSTFNLHTPEGDIIDLEDSVIDVGYDQPVSICGGTATYLDKNGYLVSSFLAEERGLYIADVRQDTVVSYAPERSIKCTKAIVGAVESTRGSYGKSLDGFDQVLNQDLEIIPLADPTNMKVGDTLEVQVLFKGEPLADEHISFVPRGTELPAYGVPNPYDMMTDMDGKAAYTFNEANYHLIAVHKETNESGTLYGKLYTFTKYTAALTVIVRPAK